MKHSRGFTVFFAVLVASLSLAIGLAIYDMTLRQLTLSGTATQSQYAISAADTGAECALYWDAKYGGSGSAFGSSSASVWPTAGSGILCNAQDVSSVWTNVSGVNFATTTFSFYVSDTSLVSSKTTCVRVEIGKYSSESTVYTTIIAHGYNTCISGSPTQVERVLQVTY